jgi:hypothetical protein
MASAWSTCRRIAGGSVPRRRPSRDFESNQRHCGTNDCRFGLGTSDCYGAAASEDANDILPLVCDEQDRIQQVEFV